LSSDTKIKQIRKDVEWSDILDQHYPYFATEGELRGIPKCEGCGKPIKDRKELRVCTRGTVTPQHFPTSHVSKFSFHNNLKCIMRAVNRNEAQRKWIDTRKYYPRFKKIIRISPELKERYKTQLSDPEKVQWIKCKETFH